ncbi:hypothetical protein [Bosea sp. (in: a-proteobacteria)]|jgi:hypothetical protein|uniref:hypothetical protein n=1 Tax=Bosea sp. (in: a-proteobacteria) TaxID=1871050 RepID=UPI002DDD2A6F|nr:hypothetical protein [Bosea sp. (in: a-proteobacteria)]HEV2510294.1 hypothetical protein [Bosea sp. (in: a-proteobacteria)]
MIDGLTEAVNRRESLVRRGRYVTTRMLVEVGDLAYLVEIEQGRIASVRRGPFVMPSWTFALRAPADAWSAFFAPVPQPGFHDLFALLKKRLLRIEGDLHPFMANLRYFKEIFAALREETHR